MIKKFISNAMLSMVMDKQAKEKLYALREVRKNATAQTGGRSPQLPPETAPAAQTEQSDEQPLPDRQALIAQAMAIHQSQTKILDNLTLNEKRKLQELAAKTLLGKNAPDLED